MSTITTINSSDLITDSRADINNNFSALNTDKMETSVLDTDTTLATNSDAKVATQKAVKAYADALLAVFTSSQSGVGNPPASSSTQTITHNLGRTPVVIRIQAIGEYRNNGGGYLCAMSKGTWNATGNSCIYTTSQIANHNATKSTSICLYTDITNSSTSGTAVIQNVGSTTFDLVWTVVGNMSAQTVYLWEAN